MKKLIIISLMLVGYTYNLKAQKREPLNNQAIGSPVSAQPPRTVANDAPIPGQTESVSPRDQIHNLQKIPAPSQPLIGQTADMNLITNRSGNGLNIEQPKLLPSDVNLNKNRSESNVQKAQQPVLLPTDVNLNASRRQMVKHPVKKEPSATPKIITNANGVAPVNQTAVKQVSPFQKMTQSGSGDRNVIHTNEPLTKEAIPVQSNVNMQGQTNSGMQQHLTKDQSEFQVLTQSGSGNRNEQVPVKVTKPIQQPPADLQANGKIAEPKPLTKEQLEFQQATQSGKPGRK